jgi:hypothetical protein
MTVVSASAGRTEVQLVARGRGNRIPPELLEAPGGLYPLKSAAFEVDEYRIMSGWPVPIPSCDIRIDCLVSAEGSVLSDRDIPTSLVTGADMRWVADVDFYDQISLQVAADPGLGLTLGGHPDPPADTDHRLRVSVRRRAVHQPECAELRLQHRGLPDQQSGSDHGWHQWLHGDNGSQSQLDLRQ